MQIEGSIIGIYIVVYDSKENFEKEETQIQYGEGNFYLGVIRFETQSEFDTIIKNFEDDDEFVICCHINYKNIALGYKRFNNLRLYDRYNLLPNDVNYLSSQDFKITTKLIADEYNESVNTFMYNEFYNKLRLDTIKIFKKENLNKNSKIQLQKTESLIKTTDLESSDSDLRLNIVIIAATEIEYEVLLKVFEIDTELESPKLFYNHQLFKKTIKNIDSDLTVGLIQQDKMGMIDASILTSIIIYKIKPTIIAMVGICAGSPSWRDVNYGDIIIPSQTFTFQFGKISQNPSDPNLDFYEPNLQNSNIIGHLIPTFSSKIRSLIKMVKKSILENDNLSIKLNNFNDQIDAGTKKDYQKIDISKLKAHQKFDIACSTSVIDKQGYFKENVEKVSRNTIALEMESYGIARACELLDKNVNCLIIKSVMDKSENKSETYKEYGCFTSSYFLKHLIENVKLL